MHVNWLYFINIIPNQVLVHINGDLHLKKKIISEHVKMETDAFLINIIEKTKLQTRNICLQDQQ